MNSTNEKYSLKNESSLMIIDETDNSENNNDSDEMKVETENESKEDKAIK